MNLIFRIPLFDFDINDPIQTEYNWPRVLDAIETSSPDLFNSIDNRPYLSLPLALQIKVRKYLIRGRYRATPFGKLAGTGLASWSDRTQGPPFLNPVFHNSLPSDIQKLNGKLADQIFLPMPGLTSRFGYHQALTFDIHLSKWCQTKIESNHFLDAFLSIAYHNISMDSHGNKLDPEKTSLDEEELEELVSTGFVYPSHQYIPSYTKSINSEVQAPMCISNQVKAILDSFVAESGDLFVKSKNLYLKDFTSWFFEKYEDRQIRLSSLLSDSDFLENQMTFGKNKNLSKPLLQNHYPESLDLKKHYPSKPICKDIYDIQLVFRIGPDGKPIIENMVCNRPFAYLGRFNQYPDFQEYGNSLKESIYSSEELIFAQLDLFESPKAQAICHVSDMFDWKINPFPIISENQIGFEDIWVGVEEDRVYLLHNHSQKEIIPIVLHPLHGDQISHPIMKLLWNIALKNPYKFIAFTTNEEMSETNSELTWGDLILLPKSSKLQSSSFKTKDSLLNFLSQKEIPPLFLAGTEDRELLIKKENPIDQEILWQELKRSGDLTLNEAPWVDSELISNSQGIPLFPQFIYRQSQKIIHQPILTPFNPIYFSDQNWIYLVLKTPYSDLLETLEYLRDFFHDKGYIYKLKWYYLVYQKSGVHEIRLRIYTPKKVAEFMLALASHLDLEQISWTKTFYYPETEKYGYEDYKKSQKLFCMESKFLFGFHEESKFNLLLPDQQKLYFLSGFWIWIIYCLGGADVYFEYFKSLCKSHNSELKSEFKSRFSYMTSYQSFGFNGRKYLEILRSHPYIWNSYSKDFLINHMHMMVNRFFPLDARVFELELWYRLYRELGKRRYGPNGEKYLSNKDWLTKMIHPNQPFTPPFRPET
ncbi:lantibiotic dehydratase [Algoriphagus vanfongensis]|uniref:lantibiotic dehydratase n=1 Tax=Algoriphagus vanfongensis TaxID=426371 RepID=UPI000420C1D6|nr:lantibiotic dehydratase [Algoriphagus vanfongensis]